MEFMFALLALLVGAALVFGGYQMARIFIPLMGFLTGMSLGGAIITSMEGTVFLGAVLGITVGFFAGLLFAVLAYLYYYAAVVVLAAGLAYWVGSSFMLWLGFEPGILSATVGFALGAVIGIVALLLNAPKYVLIGLTSIAGSVLAIGALLVLFGQIPLEAFSYTVASYAISNSWFWTLAALILAGVGIAIQSATSKDYEFEEWSMGKGGGNPVPPTVPHGA